MKNVHYIKLIEKKRDISKDEEEVLMTQIRAKAHLLDKELQLSASQPRRFSEKKWSDLSRRLNISRHKFDTDRPDFKWAEKIEYLYRIALQEGDGFQYPWKAKKKIDLPEAKFETLLTTRRSIRKFTHDEIDDAQLQKIIGYAAWAPTNCNQQSLRFVIVKTKAIRKKLMQGGMIGDMSPCVIAVLADMRFYSDGDIECPAHDSGAAIQNMLLAIHYYGLGACYTSSQSANAKKYRKLLNVKAYEKITALIWVGHYKHVPLAPARRRVSEIIRYL